VNRLNLPASCINYLKKAKIVKVLFYLMLSDLRKSLAVWKVPGLCPVAVLVRATCGRRLISNQCSRIGRMTGENRGTRGKNLSRCQFEDNV